MIRRRLLASSVAALMRAATACFPDTTPVPTSGTVAVWGSNGFGNLGIGNRVDQPLPTTFAAPPRGAVHRRVGRRVPHARAGGRRRRLRRRS